ncbi:MAG TPA: DinB family protein [Ktedonobacterales bacterium]|jgi:uncharacterized damage-inducible protein DinB|nr:DinB family protein [Ktedonobacterales bacterium]
MADDLSAPTLMPFYDGWEAFNRLLVRAVAPLTPDRLALRVTPGQRTAAEIVGHIVSARAWWFHHTLGEGSAEVEQFYPWDDDDSPPTLNAAELEIGLETTWRLIATSLSNWTPTDLSATFTTYHGDQRTRQWVIWHVLEHDMYHGGELSLTLGAHGVAGLDL